MNRNKYLLTLILIGLIGLIGLASAQVDTTWVRRYNGPPGTNSDGTYALAVDGAGNVYVTGRSTGVGSGYDYATIKYDSSGLEQWAARYNGPGNGTDNARAITVDGAGNVYVTGPSVGIGTGAYDYATIKYNSAGDTLWVRRYNGPANGSDYANAIAVDGVGNVYVTGYSAGDGTSTDYATIKYNSVGDTLWVRRYNGPGNSMDAASAIAVDGTGNIYVTGYAFGSSTGADYATIKYNSAGDTLWVRTYTELPGVEWDIANAIAVDGAGNVYVTGQNTSDFTAGGNNYATVKYDSSGVEQWVRRYNGPGDGPDYAYAIAVDGTGNVYVTGQSQGTGTDNDYATIKYNSAGDTLWVRRYNGPANDADQANAIAVDGAGNVYVTGSSTGSGTSVDYATIKYNSAGDTLWVLRYNGPGNGFDAAAAIAVDGAGNVYVTGNSVGAGTGADYATIKYVQAGAAIEEHPLLSANRFSLTAEPNPFTKHTTIRYTLPIAGKVSIKFYNVTGRLVEVLNDGYLNAGTYTLKIENWKLKISKGIYFLKYESDTDKSELKLIVQ